MKETIAKWLISSEAFKAEMDRIDAKYKELLSPKNTSEESKPKRKYTKRKKNEQSK